MSTNFIGRFDVDRADVLRDWLVSRCSSSIGLTRETVICAHDCTNTKSHHTNNTKVALSVSFTHRDIVDRELKFG